MMDSRRYRRNVVANINLLISQSVVVLSEGKKYNSKVTTISRKNGMFEAKAGRKKFLCDGAMSEGSYYGKLIK